MEWAAKALARATRVDVDLEELKAVVIFCGVGLLVSLVACKVFGADLSVALF